MVPLKNAHLSGSVGVGRRPMREQYANQLGGPRPPHRRHSRRQPQSKGAKGPDECTPPHLRLLVPVRHWTGGKIKARVGD